MLDNNSRILLTVSRGKSLVRPGVYREAQIKVENSFKSNEKVTVLQPLQIQKLPVYKETIQVLNLGPVFIKTALQRPIPPKEGYYHWIKTPIGKLYQNYNKMTPKERIKIHLDEIANHLGGFVKSWEIL